MAHHIHAHSFKQGYEIHYIADFGYVLYVYRLVGEKYRADDLQSLVFRALRSDFATEGVAAFNYKLAHYLYFIT